MRAALREVLVSKTFCSFVHFVFIKSCKHMFAHYSVTSVMYSFNVYMHGSGGGWVGEMSSPKISDISGVCVCLGCFKHMTFRTCPLTQTHV